MHPSPQGIPASDRSDPVLLIGATGYIGSHIFNALSALHTPAPRVLIRSDSPTVFGREIDVVTGSIADRQALQRAMEGVSCVINAASYVGADPTALRHTYDDGVRNIIDACAEHQIDRLIHVSTTAVYGSGPHFGASATELPYSPESPTSASRALSDELVLAAGGCSVRPHLVIGQGDRWVAPAVQKLTGILGGLIDGGAALLSVIHVRDLGLLIAAVALSTRAVQGPVHAAYRQPVRAADLVRSLVPNSRAALPELHISLADALRRLAPYGFTDHQIRMIGETHWYDSSDIWDIANAFIPQTLCQTSKSPALPPKVVCTWGDVPWASVPSQ